MNIIFMGTPDFTVPILDALDVAGHKITLVVTQPDKPKDRKQELTPPPAKEWALSHEIPVFQPKRIRDPEALKELKKYKADVAVVAAFGQILPKEVLEYPTKGCINIHASLLPKYRGAAPIQWSILNGDPLTGITIMQMSEGLDDGDILLQKECVILPTDTGGSLFDKLAILGGEAITEALELLENGRIYPKKQDEKYATHVGKIDKALGHLDFSHPADELERYIRGLSPWPGAYVKFRDKVLKLWNAEVLSEEVACESGLVDAEHFHTKPGQTALITKEMWLVRTGVGFLDLKEVQVEGKKRMEIADFLRGVKITDEDCLK